MTWKVTLTITVMTLKGAYTVYLNFIFFVCQELNRDNLRYHAYFIFTGVVLTNSVYTLRLQVNVICVMPCFLLHQNVVAFQVKFCECVKGS